MKGLLFKKLKMFKGTLGCLLDNEYIDGERETALDYTDDEKVISELNDMKGWSVINCEAGKVVDMEKSACEYHWDIKSPDGKKYRYTSSWYSSIGGDSDLRGESDDYIVELKRI